MSDEWTEPDDEPVYLPQSGRRVSRSTRNTSLFTYRKCNHGIGSEFTQFDVLHSPDISNRYFWLRSLNSREEKSTETSKSALLALKQIVEEFHLSLRFEEDSARLYWKAKKQEKTTGRRVEAVIGGIVHLLAKEYEIPINAADIADLFAKTSEQIISRQYRDFARAWGYRIKPFPTEAYIWRFIGELELSAKVGLRAEDIMEAISDELSGKSTRIKAISMVYVAAKDLDISITQQKIIETLGTGGPTLRRNSQQVRELLDYKCGEGQHGQ